LTKSNKDRQAALEASEKNRARDQMIIKFREERIKELEARVSKPDSTGVTASTNDCNDCISLKK